MKNTVKKIVIPVVIAAIIIVICFSCGRASADNRDMFVRIWESFTLAFIENDGWVMLLNGLLATVLLTAITLMLGFILGTAVFVLIYCGNKIADVVFKWVRRFLITLPFTTFLFICFYLLFIRSMDRPMIAAGFALTVLWASTVCSALLLATDRVPKGQAEAAQAMGYTRMQTLRYIIMPQAMPGIMELFEDEMVSHMKETSVVGMISAIDLQKAIDIITLKTSEPAMPIIVVSVMYLLLGFLLVSLARRMGRISLSRNRSSEKILSDVKKGVLG